MAEPQIEPPQGVAWDEPIDTAPLVFLDLEMTGLVPEKDRVIELCAERVRGEALEARLCSLVRPPDDAFGNAHVHGIRPEDLASAPPFDVIAPCVEGIIADAIVVAHAASWDVRFLEAEFARAGRPIRIPYYLDTLTLSRRAFALPSHSLAALCTQLGIQRDRPHRADDDVQALRQVFRHIIRVLLPSTPRDLWHVRIGERRARPAVIAAAVRALEHDAPVRVRYRPARRGPEDLIMCVTGVRTDLDPPRVLGYLLPARGRRELRADRILAIESAEPASGTAVRE